MSQKRITTTPELPTKASYRASELYHDVNLEGKVTLIFVGSHPGGFDKVFVDRLKDNADVDFVHISAYPRADMSLGFCYLIPRV